MKPSALIPLTLLISAPVIAQDINFPPQAGQWELKTDLTDLEFRNDSWSANGDTTNGRFRFRVNGEALYSIDDQLSVGAYAAIFRNTTSDGDGESLGGSSYFVIKPIVRYFLNDNFGVGFSYQYYSGRSLTATGTILPVAERPTFSPG